ncbi:putative SNAP25 homologous protein SNAP30 [Zingiber officinale]|uniref:putative SNAP25 homologous protein SNAP30 n=1 Tax=Zingiber officinale TaxID=94328 RepID=UPI001C4A9962|nr:putative SNAP25 homologous protein SNAP30 [Zingiber officinale]
MPVSKVPKQGRAADPFDSDSDTELYKPPSKDARNKYKNDFSDTGGFENQSVQELEKYAAYKAEETTSKVNDCLKIAEIIKEDASNTLTMLHQQGDQINRTHEICVTIDKDLSRGESLLGSLGGFFSMPWKPKKTKEIKGPAVTADNSSKATKEQRDKLGLSSNGKGQSKPREYAEPTSAMDKVQIEKSKQDDGLDDLSDVLGQLKGMAVDMGSEIERQNKALDGLQDDVDELNSRVKGANQRARKILGK